MTVELDHIIIPARDRQASARFLAGILGLSAGPPLGPFVPLRVGNGVTLDYADATDFHSHHCAFLVGDEEFDAAFARIRSEAIPFYADPHHTRPGEINHRNGGRGFYFEDPAGHNMELLTRAA
jgi:catechol 2,3-dioxygenase-like lactoylglutathione lyase family enzyme